jgi:hypothetical protein
MERSDCVPGVGDDDVVEGRVSAPEARKSDLDHHVCVGVAGGSQWVERMPSRSSRALRSRVRDVLRLAGNFGLSLVALCERQPIRLPKLSHPPAPRLCLGTSFPKPVTTALSQLPQVSWNHPRQRIQPQNKLW